MTYQSELFDDCGLPPNVEGFERYRNILTSRIAGPIGSLQSIDDALGKITHPAPHQIYGGAVHVTRPDGTRSQIGMGIFKTLAAIPYEGKSAAEICQDGRVTATETTFAQWLRELENAGFIEQTRPGVYARTDFSRTTQCALQFNLESGNTMTPRRCSQTSVDSIRGVSDEMWAELTKYLGAYKLDKKIR